MQKTYSLQQTFMSCIYTSINNKKVIKNVFNN